MAWSTPRTWVATELVTAAYMNQDVRDNLTFLYAPPSARVYNSANITGVVTATLTALTFDSERWDNDTIHSTATNTSRLTATTAGKYGIWANVRWDSNTAGTQRIIRLRHNGSTLFASSTQAVAANIEQFIYSEWQMAAGDYVECMVYHDSGSNRTVEVSSPAGYAPEFGMTWRSS